MRSNIFYSFLFLLFLCACGNNSNDATSENDVDAARNFIRSALDGNYEQAKNYMLQDSVNLDYLKSFERNYKSRMSREDKQGYKEASINIHSVRQVNDSVSVVRYSNSFKKQNDSLKAVKRNNDWLIDFKYSFATTDTLP